MATIPLILEDLVKRRPFLQEALSRGIINHAALAENIRPEIEKALGKEVKFSAVNMAIRRLAEKLNEQLSLETGFDPNCSVTAKSNLIELTLHKMGGVQDKIKSLYDFIDYRKGDYFSVTQGQHEIMIITDKKHSNKLHEIFSADEIKIEVNNVGSVTIQLQDTAIETTGLFYVATRALNWDAINIIDIISTYTEMTFILAEQDTMKGFEILRRVIER